MRKVPAPGDFRVQEDWGATDHAWLPSPEERALAEQIVGLAADLVGEPLLYARVDLLTGPRGEAWVNELELVEPCLFLRHGPGTAERLADGVLARIAAR